MRAVAAGHDVVGIDARPTGSSGWPPATRSSRTCRRVALEAALRDGRYAVTDDALACEGFDVAVVTVPTPLHEGAPDLSYIESAARMLAPHVRPGCLVVLESTTYPGTTEQLFVPILEARLRARSPAATSPSATARSGSTRATRPGTWRPRRSWSPASTPSPSAASAAFYSTFVDRTVPVSTCRGGGDGQAAGEHVPARQRRAGQRAGDVRPRPRHRRLGGDRRGRDQAVRVHEVHPGPGRRRPLPADRPELPVLDRTAAAGPVVPVRRAGQRHQRPHARLRGLPADAGAEPAGRRRVPGQGAACSAWPTSATPATPGSPRGGADPPAARRRRRGLRGRPARGRADADRRADPAGRR